MDPRTRDAAVSRLRRLTALTAAGATALAGAFAGLAASSVPGRKAARPSGSLRLPVTRRRPVRARPVRRPAAAPVATTAAPPPAAPVTTTAAPPPAPPPAAPAPTPAPPVVVSGGS